MPWNICLTTMNYWLLLVKAKKYVLWISYYWMFSINTLLQPSQHATLSSCQESWVLTPGTKWASTTNCAKKSRSSTTLSRGHNRLFSPWREIIPIILLVFFSFFFPFSWKRPPLVYFSPSSFSSSFLPRLLSIGRKEEGIRQKTKTIASLYVICFRIGESLLSSHCGRDRPDSALLRQERAAGRRKYKTCQVKAGGSGSGADKFPIRTSSFFLLFLFFQACNFRRVALSLCRPEEEANPTNACSSLPSLLRGAFLWVSLTPDCCGGYHLSASVSF